MVPEFREITQTFLVPQAAIDGVCPELIDDDEEDELRRLALCLTRRAVPWSGFRATDSVEPSGRAA